MSFAPVAHATVGYQLLSAQMAEVGIGTRPAESRAMPCLESGAELGLGTNDVAQIDLVEVSL